MRPVEVPAAPRPDPFSDPLSVALVAEMLERGYVETTVAGVAARAGVSVAAFGARFADLDQCAIDTYERGAADFKRRVGGAFNRRPDWQSALRAAAYEAVDWLEEHAEIAKFGNTELLRMRSEMARVRREEVFRWCTALVERGREAAPDPDRLPEGTATLAAGSFLQLFTIRQQEGGPLDLQSAVRESLYGVVRIYLGEDAARKELASPRP
jgi:AcrR family transcriptional regulator